MLTGIFDFWLKRRVGASVIGYIYFLTILTAIGGYIYMCVLRWNAAVTQEQQTDAALVNVANVPMLLGALLLVRLVFEFVAMLYAIMQRAESAGAPATRERANDNATPNTGVQTSALTPKRDGAAA